jgi:hypothetical protein
VVTGQQINNLLLVLRDPYQLILLSPGANQSNSILGGLSVNGTGERNNNFLLDGTDNNDSDIPGLTLPQPGLTTLNPDAVQEFRIITGNRCARPLVLSQFFDNHRRQCHCACRPDFLPKGNSSVRYTFNGFEDRGEAGLSIWGCCEATIFFMLQF